MWRTVGHKWATGRQQDKQYTGTWVAVTGRNDFASSFTRSSLSSPHLPGTWFFLEYHSVELNRFFPRRANNRRVNNKQTAFLFPRWICSTSSFPNSSNYSLTPSCPVILTQTTPIGFFLSTQSPHLKVDSYSGLRFIHRSLQSDLHRLKT